MKTYIKPTFEFVELRPEERLAGCGNGNGNGNGYGHNKGKTCVIKKGKITGHGYDFSNGPGNGNAYGHIGNIGNS